MNFGSATEQRMGLPACPREVVEITARNPARAAAGTRAWTARSEPTHARKHTRKNCELLAQAINALNFYMQKAYAFWAIFFGPSCGLRASIGDPEVLLYGIMRG